MADLATLQFRLTEAQTALHKVATGRAVELVAEDGSTIRYNRANQETLERYIRDMQGQIGLVTSGARRRGPVRFVF